jgi:hypothetical protein
MFKLAAVVRNHFVVFPYFEAKPSSSRNPRQTLAPIVKGSGTSWRIPNVIVPKPSAALHSRLSPAEIEAIHVSMDEVHLPASAPALLPDSSLAFLACKAPAVCSQLLQMSRSQRKTVA